MQSTRPRRASTASIRSDGRQWRRRMLCVESGTGDESVARARTGGRRAVRRRQPVDCLVLAHPGDAGVWPPRAATGPPRARRAPRQGLAGVAHNVAAERLKTAGVGATAAGITLALALAGCGAAARTAPTTVAAADT